MARTLLIPLPVLFFLLIGPAENAKACPQEGSPWRQRIEEIRVLVAEKPDMNTRIFHPDFLAKVPAPNLTLIFSQYFRQCGKVTRCIQSSAQGKFYGEYVFHTEKGMHFPVKLDVDSKSPHQVHTLWFGLVQPELKSLEELLEQLNTLEGNVSFGLWRLGPDAPVNTAALNPSLPLAIGSTFKLYILGSLTNTIDEGKTSWDTVLRLREDWKSWPSGTLHRWPEGAPITLYSLAGQMISLSDNTATDHALFFLGREQVDSILEVMGHKLPDLNKPFLSTREMFLIKSINRADILTEAYISRNDKGRRAFLEEEIVPMDREDFEGINQLHPTAIESVEWFASAADLCRAVDWIRRNTEDHDPSAGTRALLAINTGMEFDERSWKYVGYKGGPEPGVMNMTWLLERRDGAWFALSSGWNHLDRTLDENRFMSLMQGPIHWLGEKKEMRRGG